MAFTSLSILELVHSINVRTDESILKIKPFKNLYLTGAIILGIFLQVIVTIIPQAWGVFEVTKLNITQWLMVTVISVLPIVLVELQKKINNYKFGEKIITNERISFK